MVERTMAARTGYWLPTAFLPGAGHGEHRQGQAAPGHRVTPGGRRFQAWAGRFSGSRRSRQGDGVGQPQPHARGKGPPS